jgi:Helix-hairpin-helix motif
MVSKKFILSLCCAIGVALPLAVKAQLPKPTTPDSNPAPSSGDMPTSQPSSPPDLGAPPPSSGSSTPPASAPTTPAPGDAMPPSGGTPTPAPGEMTPPASGEPTPPPMSKPNPIPKKVPKKNSLPSVQGGSGKSTGKVDINSATFQEMTKVRGITAADAKKIITNRPYSSLNDLVTKKVLTQGQFSQVKSKLSF